ncbi:MAG TPA: glycosyltransferase family 4 protein [Polyangiaceae bacterium]|jgi:glycosyltransferase involved in cell wall biosynthesis
MTVLFLDPVGTLGGAERSLVDLVASLRAAEPSLPIGLILGAEGPLAAEVRAHGAEVRVLPLPRRLMRAGDHSMAGLADVARHSPALLSAGASLGTYARELDRVIRSFGPAVIHSNGMKMHLLSAMLPRRGVRTVWHMRDFVGQRTVMAPVLRAVEARVDAIVAISQSIAEDAARTLRRQDVAVVYNGIDTRRFTPVGDVADLDALAGLPEARPGTLRFGLVATYARWKGQEVFIEAAARFARRAPRASARFYVIGGTAYDTDSSQFSREELQGRIAQLGLEGFVGLVPFLASPETAYRSLDVAVHASTRPEPFGRTIAEGMACGRTLIVAREGGAAELGTDGVDVIRITPRDPDALASAMLELAADPARRTAIGTAARQTALSRFSRERLGPEVLSVYRRIGAIR